MRNLTLLFTAFPDLFTLFYGLVWFGVMIWFFGKSSIEMGSLLEPLT